MQFTKHILKATENSANSAPFVSAMESKLFLALTAKIIPSEFATVFKLIYSPQM